MGADEVRQPRQPMQAMQPHISLSSYFLLDVTYDGASIILHVYDTGTQRSQVLRIRGFQSFFYGSHIPEQPDAASTDAVRYDCMADDVRICQKIPFGTPDTLRQRADAQTDRWDHKMDMPARFLADTGLRAGCALVCDDNGCIDFAGSACVPGAAEVADRWDAAQAEEAGRRYDEMSTVMLEGPVPDVRRVAIDIEVEPNGRGTLPAAGETRITTICLSGSDGLRSMLTLAEARPDTEKGQHASAFAGDEAAMITAALDVCASYPIVLTYNGDDFDLPFMQARLQKLVRGGGGDNVFARYNARFVHIDLYKVFSNRALHLYAFGQKYSSFGLDAVCKALLGYGKEGDYVEGDAGGSADENGKNDGGSRDAGSDAFGSDAFGSDAHLHALARYCMHDADITLGLVTYDDAVVMKILWFMCRITAMPVSVVSRTAVSAWSQSMIESYMRACGILIPNRHEIRARAAGLTDPAEADSEITKKYKGAVVFEPSAGKHFDIAVVDFASLYPSIVKEYNVSFDTIRCVHPECRAEHMIPGTPHWFCGKRTGIMSGQIGRLRDLRVSRYKPSDDPLHRVLASCLKVFLNASYGVLGFEHFEMYLLPAAEAVTAYGRHIIKDTARYCDQSAVNLKRIYGDTDSLFVENEPAKIQKVIEYAQQKHGITLEHEKTYRLVLFGALKKNYLGVRDTGTVDVKGLSAKKSNAPRIIRDIFGEMMSVITTGIHAEGDIPKARRDIIDAIRGGLSKADSLIDEWAGADAAGRRDIADYLSVTTQVARESYGVRGRPEHIRAVYDAGMTPQKGERITYLKCEGQQPLLLNIDRGASGNHYAADLAGTHVRIDKARYHALIMSSTGQLAGMLDITKDQIRGQQTLF